MKPITILLIDDHALIRETWSMILNTNSSFQVVGEAGSAEEGLELVSSLSPAVVIMDINLPGINGIEATEALCKLHPTVKVLGVSLHTQPTYAKKMMAAGALGYVTKNSSREEMFAAIADICMGKKYICQEIKDALSKQLCLDKNEQVNVHDLTEGEQQVVHLVMQGLSSKEIAETFSISPQTVELHRYNILLKMGLKNSAALVSFLNEHQPG